jgi:protein-tyrosine phosphatase
MTYFSNTNDIINEALINQQKVLIHCQAGISRSATIIIAYLMKENKMKMNDAYYYVYEKRQCIAPNIGFTSQLLVYEDHL